jgi:D-sedoheptulose 7-phosphate isomerase
MYASCYKAISLTTDTSVITCIANDFGYDKIFERQLQAHGVKGDLLIAFSTSGKSKNIVNLLKMAKRLKIKSISLLGYDGGVCKKLSDYSYIVPSNSTANIQEVHHLIGHIFCSLVD